MKPGYLYILVHPSDTDLYKVGVTILHPKERLAQHNRNHEEYAGRIVKETGQEWELKTYIAVPDPYWAEKAFWGATHFPEIPFRRGIEVEKNRMGISAERFGCRFKSGGASASATANKGSAKSRMDAEAIGRKRHHHDWSLCWTG